MMISLRSSLMMVALASLVATGCSDESKEADAPESKGNRIPVMIKKSAISSDASLADIDVVLPSSDALTFWRQINVTSSHAVEHLASTMTAGEDMSATAGEGNGWRSRFIPAPVASDNLIFAIDAKGYISAHNKQDVTKPVWVSDALKHKETQLPGGGLALSGSTLIAANAIGVVAGINSQTGEKLWERNLQTPVRSAPSVSQEMIIIATAGSETYAIDSRDGKIVWKHKGIQEDTNILSYATPAIVGNIVVAAYPSGEMFALHRLTGKPLWADSLLMPRRTSALGNFTGVTGNPVIARNVVFAASSNGIMAANSLNNGLRLWEHEISSYNTLWVAGRFVFAVTSDHKLLAIHAADGRIKWMTDLTENAEPVTRYMGPFVVNDAIGVISSEGEWMQFSADSGALIATEKKFNKSGFSQPIFLEQGVAFVDGDAELHLLK